MASDGTGMTPGQSAWTDGSRFAGAGPRYAGAGPRGGWQIVWRVAAGVVVVLLVAAFVAGRWSVSYDAITPGTPVNVAQLITVPRGAAHTHRGSVILTDVRILPLTALGYLYYRFDEHAQIVSTAELTGGASSSAYSEQGIIEMATARQAAVLVALRALGYHPRAVPAGAVVDATEPGAAGDSVLAVGDVITAVDSKSTPRLGPLTALVTATPPGTSLQFTFHRLGTTTTRQRSLVVGELERVGPASAPSYPCVGVGAKEGPVVRHAGRPQSCLPFGAEQLYKDEDEPFRVSIQADGIAGPSAGLSFTLGLVEKLDRADLTGGRRVAATGTMSNNGAVGAIGGVAQKTVAVREAGASVFLVPPANAAVARANAGPTLRVIAVSSIGQAVAALERLGGRLVPATGPR
ncbi:MAG: S16 family serine protease [Acidimicrobiales bacterium]